MCAIAQLSLEEMSWPRPSHGIMLFRCNPESCPTLRCGPGYRTLSCLRRASTPHALSSVHRKTFVSLTLHKRYLFNILLQAYVIQGAFIPPAPQPTAIKAYHLHPGLKRLARDTGGGIESILTVVPIPAYAP